MKGCLPGGQPSARAAYRVRQFQQALLGGRQVPAENGLRCHLSPAEVALFRRMQPSEQRHAWTVLERLLAAGQTDPDLCTAALLHDVGKVLAPLSLAGRVGIVLGRRLAPQAASRWGQAEIGKAGLRRAFVVAARHPEWGAALAAEAGTRARACELIRCHQAPAGDDRLLAALQAADDES